MASVAVTTVVLLSLFSLIAKSEECIQDFHQLRNSLLVRGTNIENLREAFFPENRQASAALEVLYYFNTSLSENTTSDVFSDSVPSDYRFQWASSQLHILLRPSVLQGLSLHIYQPQTETVRLVIDLICFHPTDGSNAQLTCNETEYLDTDRGLAVRLLNRLTVRLKSYALNGDDNVLSDESIGYSSYFHNNENSDDTCVIGFEIFYDANYALLAISMVCLALLVITATPIGIIYSCNSLQEKIKRSPNLQYFIWASVIVSFVSIFVIIGIDLGTIINRAVEVEGNIIIFYWISIAGIIMGPILSLIVVVGVGRFSPHVKNVDFDQFPMPNLFFCSNEKWMQFAAIFIFNTILLGITIHSVFILLALNVAAFQVIPIVIFYAAAIFCIISFVALFLKVFNFQTFETGNVLQGVVALIIGTLFLGFVLCFVIFFVSVTILAGENSTGELGGGVIGDLLPAAVLALLGYLAQKLLQVESSSTEEIQDVEGGKGDETATKDDASMSTVELGPTKKAECMAYITIV